MSIIELLKSCAAAIACSCVATAGASTASSDISDMWWNPDESGWGVNVALQKDVAFLTFFVYDASNNPVWYTSDVHLNAGTSTFNGNLYATRGPAFNGPFTGGVSVRTAGTVTFALADLNHATLTYTVDGVGVTKNVQRQTWANEDYSGNYIGAYSFRNSNCTGGAANGIDEAGGTVAVTQTGSAMTVAFTTASSTCNFAGTYNQTGKIGTLSGNFSCSNGVQGPFLMYELSPTLSGFNGRIAGQHQFCTFNGFIGGIRRTS